MIAFAAVLVTATAILFTLAVRRKDLPEPEPISPTAHLEERKAAIYDNLRDLQFEYRVGKLSDRDYQQTKVDLQRELAGVLAEIDRIGSGAKPAPIAKPKPVPVVTATTCPRCGAQFAQPLKFCGECGSPMAGGTA